MAVADDRPPNSDLLTAVQPMDARPRRPCRPAHGARPLLFLLLHNRRHVREQLLRVVHDPVLDRVLDAADALDLAGAIVQSQGAGAVDDGGAANRERLEGAESLALAPIGRRDHARLPGGGGREGCERKKQDEFAHGGDIVGADMSHPKLARPDYDIHELISRRWSPRAFDPARTVPRAELLRLFEAARWAPSSFNEQPWRFLVTMRDETAEPWRRLLSTLSTRNQSWALAAPVLVLAAVRATFEKSGEANQFGWYDAGQAVAYLSFQATAQGLGLRQMEGFDRQRARTEMVIPDEFEPAVVIAIGYAGDPASLAHDPHREAERTPRRRKPISDFVYEGKWPA